MRGVIETVEAPQNQVERETRQRACLSPQESSGGSSTEPAHSLGRDQMCLKTVETGQRCLPSARRASEVPRPKRTR